MARAIDSRERPEVERVTLERIATRRGLTDAEDARLAELTFLGHRRGYRLRFDAARAPAGRSARA